MPDQFIVFLEFSMFLGGFQCFKVACLVGSLPQLLVGEQEAGGVANHALVLPTKPVYCDGDGCEYGGGWRTNLL